MEQRVLTCSCGKVVKVKNYGLLFKKNSKSKNISSFNPDRYSCSKCRGVIIPPKPKVIKEERVHLAPNYF